MHIHERGPPELHCWMMADFAELDHLSQHQSRAKRLCTESSWRGGTSYIEIRNNNLDLGVACHFEEIFSTTWPMVHQLDRR